MLNNLPVIAFWQTISDEDGMTALLENDVYQILSNNLPDHRILHIESFKDYEQFKTKDDKIKDFVIYATKSEDWRFLSYIGSIQSQTPIFLILNPAEYKTQENDGLQLGAKAVFSSDKIGSLAGLLKIPIKDEINKQNSDNDTDFIKEFSAIRSQLRRLDEEFHTTAIRTLPQPHIASDTTENLRVIRKNLEKIKIAP